MWVHISNNQTLTLSSETTLKSSRGAGGLCSSTLEKLKGFTCSADPNVGRSDPQWDEKKTDGASSKICEHGSNVGPLRSVSNKHSDDTKPQEEQEDEEEEVGEKAATKQVHNVNVDSLTSLSSVAWAA